jgi:hypothetical protein
MVERSSLLLATGLLFFSLFMPLFSFVGDMSIKCEIRDSYDCGDYVLMQGVAAGGLGLGLMLSVGGAYQSRIKSPSKSMVGMYSIVEANNIASDDDYLCVASALDKIKQEAEQTIQNLLIQNNDQSNQTSQISNIESKQRELQKQIDNIDNIKAELRLEVDEYVKNKIESPSLQLNDSAVAGGVTVNNANEVAMAAIKAYQMGQESR